MAIEFREITRGRAMVFVRVVLTGTTQASQLVASAKTREGNEIPAAIVDQGVAGECALVMPQLNVEVSVTLSDGAHEKRMALSPWYAKRSSQLNTLIHNQRAERIRNADIKVRHSSNNIFITDVIPDWDNNQVIVHGAVEAQADFVTSGSSAKVQVVALERGGRAVEGSNSIVLGSYIEPTTEQNGFAKRRIDFSLRLPSDPPDIVFWARGIKVAGGDIFLALTADDLRARRDGFAAMTCSAMNDIAYQDWFMGHRATREELASQRGHHFDLRPSFSIVVPLFKTPLNFLHAMTDSVLAQTYPNLQLILVNASPEDDSLRREVSSIASLDSRVTVITLENNRGITENTNAGIAAAKGDFVSFLDHDDIIEPDLLYEYAKGINDYRDTDLLYCDEDELKDGTYCKPNFKPDWDPEMICSHNYVCHMLTIRRAVLDTIPLPTRDLDGAQDHFLTLTAGEIARNVYHVRKPLYHWRVSAGSTASDPDAKPYTTKAGILALQRHLDRVGIPASASQRGTLPNFYQLDYRLSDAPLISIVIPSKDNVPVLKRCLTSIFDRTAYRNFEILIVENNSRDSATYSYYKYIQDKSKQVHVVTYCPEGGFNYSAINNYGVSKSKGRYVVLLNNDTEVISADWLTQLVGPCTADGVGVVGAKLLYPDQTIQHAGVTFHRAGPSHLGMHLPDKNHDYYEYYQVMRDATAVTGACLLTSRSLWDVLGGMDESLAVNYNDVDYCLRAWKVGYRVVYQPNARLYHYESITRGISKNPEQAIQWRAEEGTLMERYPRYYANGDRLQNPNVEGLYHHLHW